MKKLFLLAAVFALFAVTVSAETESFTDWATRAFSEYPLATVTKVEDNLVVGLVYIDCPVFLKSEVREFCRALSEYAFDHYPKMREFVSFWVPNTGTHYTYKVYFERAVKTVTPDPFAYLFKSPSPSPAPTAEPTHYVLNKNSKKFHLETCRSALEIKEKNRQDFYGTREAVIEQGYVPCKLCNP